MLMKEKVLKHRLENLFFIFCSRLAGPVWKRGPSAVSVSRKP